MDSNRSLSDWLGLGLEPGDLELGHVCLRGLIVFLVTVAIVRVSHRRFLARLSAFDAVLGFILASCMARAINGSAPFLPTLAVGFVLALLHRLMSLMAYRWPLFRRLVEGSPSVIVSGGNLEREKLQRHRIAEEDLLQEARLHGRVTELSRIETATLERNGQISVVPRS